MSSQKIADMQHKLYNKLQERHLQSAFAIMHTLVQELQQEHVETKLEELETSYRYMIQYMLDGVKDPEREHIYKHLLREAYSLADIICEQISTKNVSTLYYTRKRTLNKMGMKLSGALSRLDNAIGELALNMLLPEEEGNTPKRKEIENTSALLFDLVWTNYPANAQDYIALREALQPHHLPATATAHIVSALTLNVIHNFDEEKINLLIDVYCNHNDSDVQIRAMCGIFLAVMQHNTRLPLFGKLCSRISLLHDNERFVADLRNMIYQFIRSRDTEKITRKMNDELLPKVMKISPNLYKKIREDDAAIDIESLEYNPEWQEILDETGISEHIKELNELQMEGADVFMSAFAHLKGFDFFNTLSNWFIPFKTTHTAVAEILENKDWGKLFAQILQTSGMMCNSDKYSLCLSLSQVPESQRRMMAQQFDSQNSQLQEEAKAELYRQSRERENISNRYVQDLYRFIKLHPQRKEFTDFFATPVEIILQIEEFAAITHDEKFLKILGEYLFKNSCHNDAIYIFELLSHNNFTDSQLYQKIGYCHQSKGEYETALEYYLKADLIKPDNVWTLRRIATCYRNTKKTETAINYFLKADNLAPDNLSVNLNIGHCYLELKQYDEALKYFFKVDYLDTHSTKARRPLAWCSFLAGKYEQARRYYEKILSDKPTASDYLNAGHVELVMGNMKDAITLYRQSIETDKNDITNFTRNYAQDCQDLIKAGIDPNELPIVYDQVIYSIQEKK